MLDLSFILDPIFLEKQTTKVVIIGGGAAGIGAAEFLHNQGIDFLLIEARPRLGGRISMANIGGYGVELGANWIHGQHNNGYDPTGTKPPKFTNPVWKFHQEHPNVLKGVFTDYSKELLIFDNGKSVDKKLEDLAWENVEKAIEKCVEISKGLWSKYCQEKAGIEEVEKEDLTMTDCVLENMSPDAPMDRVSIALRNAFMWEEIEFETGIFNCSMMNISPLNNVDRIQYNDRDWFVKNG